MPNHTRIIEMPAVRASCGACRIRVAWVIRARNGLGIATNHCLRYGYQSLPAVWVPIIAHHHSQYQYQHLCPPSLPTIIPSISTSIFVHHHCPPSFPDHSPDHSRGQGPRTKMSQPKSPAGGVAGHIGRISRWTTLPTSTSRSWLSCRFASRRSPSLID